MGENGKENYQAPATEVLVLKAEGIVCQSGLEPESVIPDPDRFYEGTEI